MRGRPEPVQRVAARARGLRGSVRVRAAVLVAVTVVGVASLVAGTALPTADLTVTPDPAAPGEQVTLDATGSTGNESITGCEFDVDGDGTFELAADDCVDTWTYTETGTYNVTVRVFEGDRTDTATRLLTVSEPPVVELGYSPTAPSVGETVTFEASASDPDGNVTAYVWYVDGEFASETAGATLERDFATAGTHNVTVAVFDDAGHEVSRTVQVTVEPTPTPTRTPTPTPTAGNEAPTAELQAETTAPAVGQEVAFEVAATDPDGEVVSVTWLVDGEAVREGEGLVWTFETAGTHEVAVAVTDDDGATIRRRVTVEVRAAQAATPTPTPTGPPVPVVPVLVGGVVVALAVAAGVGKLVGGGAAGASAGGGGSGGSGDGRDDPLREDAEQQIEDEAEDRARDEREDRDDDDDRDDDEAVVHLRADGFDPVRTSVDRRTTVRWHNADDERHVVEPVRTTEEAADWTLGDAALEPGATTEHTFRQRGVYEFRAPDCGGEPAVGVVLVAEDADGQGDADDS